LDSKLKHLVIILGPTGVGKSVAGVYFAEKFNGEIINCDSMQVYRGFDIGTDKPTAAMRRKVRHHLLDIVDFSTQFTAADFVKEALTAIRWIEQRGGLPFIVGGTGLYLKALLEGLFPGPGRDAALRARLEQEVQEAGLERLRQKLEEVDPVYARLIGERDRIRIIRALEVYYLTQKPISQHFADTRSTVAGFHSVKIGLQLERSSLYRKIEERVERMFQSGILEEVRNLLASGVGADAPPFRGLGYKYVLRHLNGEIGLDEAILLTKKDTRHYAKRQITWFRKIPEVSWFKADDFNSISGFLKELLKA
jgi:tRNA dimethylallyltransferase